ncbi:MAG: hypothetical protein HQL06_08730 [Nitrospirae bacterium]|nr:hypothetical protein [Nitrospirota bacterium]
MTENELKVKLFVMDTGPLITLAVAESLSYLLYPDVAVYIPDAVIYEATIKSGALGAENIALWVQEHSELVHIIITQAYVDYQTLRNVNPMYRKQDLGEEAALEAIRYGLHLDTNERAVLLTEDDRDANILVLPQDHDRLIPLTTFDFLVGLELAGRIKSAEEVYRIVAKEGRNASRLYEQARKAVERLLKQKC